MKLSRDKYVPNTEVYVEKLVRKVLEKMDFDTMWQSAYQGLTNHYIDNDQCFVDDYYETFPNEDPELNVVQEEKVEEKIIYYHGHHSNPCIVGEIVIPEFRKNGSFRGYNVIAVTHKMAFEDYGDELSDVTKMWDAHVEVEVLGIDRYDTDYDSCIHIPLNVGEHTTLANQVLDQILIDNNVEFVILSEAFDNQVSLEEFSGYLKNV